MNDDLLRALGRHQREDLEQPEPLDPLDPTDDELSRPFDDDERAAILDGLFERLDAAPAAEEVAPPVEQAPAPAAVEQPPSEGGAEVIPLVRRRWGVIGSAMAAAAALVLWWVVPDRDGDPLVASVPEYAITQLDGGIAEQRSEPTEPATELKLRRDTDILWVLTPAEPVAGEVAVALLARSESGEQKFVPRLDVQVSPEGAIRMSGPLSGFVELSPGTWSLTMFVAEPDSLPTSAPAEAGPWRALSVRLIVTE